MRLINSFEYSQQWKLIFLNVLVGIFFCNCTDSAVVCPLGSLLCDEDKCIDESDICDSIPHCDDDRDELGCECSLFGWMVCEKDRECYTPNQQCDSTLDCSDGSDEQDCPFTPTEASMTSNEILASTETFITSTESSMTLTEASITSTEDSLTSTESSMTRTEASIPSTEASMPSTEASMPSTEASMPSTEASMPSTEASITSTAAFITENDDSVAVNGDSIAGNDNTLTVNDDSIAGNDDSITANDDSITGNGDFITGKGDSISSSEMIMDKVNSVVESTQKSITSFISTTSAAVTASENMKRATSVLRSWDISSHYHCFLAGITSITFIDLKTICNCKRFVEGPSCEKCVSGTFQLHKRNVHGCQECFCMNTNSTCVSSNMKRKKMYMEKLEVKQLDIIKRAKRRKLNKRQKKENKRRNNKNIQSFKLPKYLLGDKVSSYGGAISIHGKNIAPGFSAYLKIKGNGLVLEQRLKSSKRKKLFVFNFDEGLWKRRVKRGESHEATRADLLSVLANVTNLIFRATLQENQTTLFVKNLTLDYAIYDAKSSKVAPEIEVCKCPEGYDGSSCQRCAFGYEKVEESFDEQHRLHFQCKKKKEYIIAHTFNNTAYFDKRLFPVFHLL